MNYTLETVGSVATAGSWLLGGLRPVGWQVGGGWLGCATCGARSSKEDSTSGPLSINWSLIKWRLSGVFTKLLPTSKPLYRSKLFWPQKVTALELVTYGHSLSVGCHPLTIPHVWSPDWTCTRSSPVRPGGTVLSALLENLGPGVNEAVLQTALLLIQSLGYLFPPDLQSLSSRSSNPFPA